ncbi:MAG: hypothetical protein VX399_06225 [SAR324 cluster bacterium]|nr:hypothetical protein [SAR324 cluster bacterium]
MIYETFVASFWGMTEVIRKDSGAGVSVKPPCSRFKSSPHAINRADQRMMDGRNSESFCNSACLHGGASWYDQQAVQGLMDQTAPFALRLQLANLPVSGIRARSSIFQNLDFRGARIDSFTPCRHCERSEAIH